MFLFAKRMLPEIESRTKNSTMLAEASKKPNYAKLESLESIGGGLGKSVRDGWENETVEK